MTSPETTQDDHSPTPPRAVALIGVGEMGGVFARAFLRSGFAVHPVLRGDDQTEVARRLPRPDLVLVTVGEADLADTLETVPESWRNRLLLIQNELLPRSWQAHGIVDPTVAVVWFEKKPGQDVKVIVSSPVGGPHAALVVEALDAVGIAAHEVRPDDELEAELVAKNLYILTANLAGLDTGGTVIEMWQQHNGLANAVASDVLDIQEHLVGHPVDRDAAVQGMLHAIAGDPDHKTTGRSAPDRLKRAISHADDAGLEVETLRELAARHLSLEA